jgi:hypothetical protein
LQRLRRPGALCFTNPQITNAGLGIGISFNCVLHASPEGALEIALRRARIAISTPTASPAWEWDPDVLTTISLRTQKNEDTQLRTNFFGETNSNGSDITADIGGKLSAGIAALSGSTNAKELSKSEKRRDQTSTAQRKTSTEISEIEIQRTADTFYLIFNSSISPDLVSLNPFLTRLNIVSTPFPSEIPLQDLTISLSNRISVSNDQISHSLFIRHASGQWSALQESNNKRIIGEILLSKFLFPAHETQALWPNKQVPE